MSLFGGDSSHERRSHERLRALMNGRWDAMDADTQLAFRVMGEEFDALNRNVRSLRNVVVAGVGLLTTSTVGLTFTLLAKL